MIRWCDLFLAMVHDDDGDADADHDAIMIWQEKRVLFLVMVRLMS